MLLKFSSLFICCFVLTTILNWKSPNPNFASKKSIHASIHDDNKKIFFTFENDQKNVFTVYLVDNTQSDCLNPYFPAIHITTNTTHNAWIHIVYTDSRIDSLKCFIDAPSQDSVYSTYPFYTYEQDFYDAPLWSYSLFHKPVNFWQGHAFAVNIDYDNKIITCLGGIGWGFSLFWFKLRPQAFVPQSLNKNHWIQAWHIIEKELAGFNQVWH